MLDDLLGEPTRAALDDYREQARRWSGQLSRLFGWLLVVEFGLVGVGFGLVMPSWPETPEFLASAAGAWLLLLAGCRGFAALAQWRAVRSSLTATRWPARAALVEAALCGGAGFVLLHASWPTRPSAIAVALTFAAAVLAAGAVLDAVAARLEHSVHSRHLMLRAGGWLGAALLVMGLQRGSASAALACAAVLIGLVEIAQGAWLLSRAQPASAARLGGVAQVQFAKLGGLGRDAVRRLAQAVPARDHGHS